MLKISCLIFLLVSVNIEADDVTKVFGFTERSISENKIQTLGVVLRQPAMSFRLDLKSSRIDREREDRTPEKIRSSQYRSLRQQENNLLRRNKRSRSKEIDYRRCLASGTNSRLKTARPLTHNVGRQNKYKSQQGRRRLGCCQTNRCSCCY